jgi:adenylate cyclase
VELLQEFANGLAAYRERQWDAAERHNRRCMEVNSKDRPSARYLERIATSRTTSPAGDWDGVWRFTHK